ncbi:signal peptidase I [Nocardioides sp. R-C-SC26]|uniref:signal peptidase I n=1 Tax=Nocardioides sp. R-C-SC26 TaxID=2870414 RepID=UPI001E502FED|nr:signal peptidase I [Nocardioides sp. R-C-SC26]
MSTDDRSPETIDDATAESEVESGAHGGDQAAPRRLALWQELLVLTGAALVVALIVKSLFVQAFYIPSDSMEPTLAKDDRILVQKVSYWFGGSPSRGDVVVFEDPGGWLGAGEDESPTGVQSVLAKIGLYPEGGHLVKRVIGVEGDVIECCDDEGRILVNGEPLDEDDVIAPRAENVQCNGPMTPTCDWTAGPVPEGTIFVLGDHRARSADSSYHLCDPEGETDCTDNPYVDVDLVVGKVFGVIWPQRHWTLLGRPDVYADIPAADGE